MRRSPLEWLATVLAGRGRKALALARAKHAALVEREHALARVNAKLETLVEQKRSLAHEAAAATDVRRLALARNRLAFVWDCQRALDAERAKLAAALAVARREFVAAERAYRALRGKSERTGAARTAARRSREEQEDRELEEMFGDTAARPGRFA
jgi:hypothetical protein